MINKDFKYAIVGASTNPEKYGHRVLKDLNEAGYQVTPVNPKGGEILGLKVSETIANIENLPDVVVTVVPPEVTIQIVKQASELGISNVWMQPGSESDEAVQYCIDNGISCVSNACIMVQRRSVENGSSS